MPLVQELTTVSASTSGDTVSVTGVTAGNAILVGITGTVSGSRSFAPSSDLDGAFDVNIDDNSGTSRISAVFALFNASGGNHTISLGWIGGLTVQVKVVEVSGLEGIPANVISRQYSEPVNTNSHQMVDPLDPMATSTGAFFFGVATLNSSTGDQTTLGSWLELSNPGNSHFYQYKEEVSSVSGEYGAWQGSGTARTGNSTVAAFPLASGGTTYDESVALSASHDLALARSVTLQATMGLTAGASLPDAASAALQAATTLAAIAGHVVAGTGTFGQSVSLTAGAGHAVSPAATFGRSMTLDGSAGLGVSASGTFGTSVSLTAAAGLTPSVIASLVAQVAFSTGASLSPTATLVAQAVAVLSASAVLDASAGGPQTYQASIDLATQVVLLAGTVHHLTSTAGFPVSAGMSSTATLTAGAVVAFGVEAAIVHAATQLHATAVALQATTGVEAASVGQFHASLAMAVAAVLQAAGATAGVPTYDVLRVASESLRATGTTGDTLRSTGVTGDTLSSAGTTDEDLA